MKKKSIVLCMILSIIITFVFAEIFSLYHFGSVPTLLTLLYLIALFSIFSYLLLGGCYIVSSKINKKKIGVRMIFGFILLFISLAMILSYLVIVNVDYLNWYMYSSPFYINVIVRSVEFLVPAIILIIISILLFKKK